MLNKEWYNQHRQLLCSELSPHHREKKIIQMTQKKARVRTSNHCFQQLPHMFLRRTRWDCLQPPNSQDQQGKPVLHYTLLSASESIVCHYA